LPHIGYISPNTDANMDSNNINEPIITIIASVLNLFSLITLLINLLKDDVKCVYTLDI